MKRFLLILLACVSCSTTVFAQFGLGLRDNRYINVNYTFASHYNVKLEHSIFSEKFGFQYIRVYAGYSNKIGELFSYSATPYYGQTWNNSYRSLGALVSGKISFLKRLNVNATVNPHYDSGLKYKTCFAIGAGVNIYRPLSIVAEYTTIPEYRVSEKRLRAGLNFHVGQLDVTPMVSLPCDGERLRALRVMTSMGFRF